MCLVTWQDGSSLWKRDKLIKLYLTQTSYGKKYTKLVFLRKMLNFGINWNWYFLRLYFLAILLLGSVCSTHCVLCKRISNVSGNPRLKRQCERTLVQQLFSKMALVHTFCVNCSVSWDWEWHKYDHEKGYESHCVRHSLLKCGLDVLAARHLIFYLLTPLFSLT